MALYNSRQFRIAALDADARALLNHCLACGGAVRSVLVRGDGGFIYWGKSPENSITPGSHPPLDVELAQLQKWDIRFGDEPKKAHELAATIELQFEGIWAVGQAQTLKPGRAYCSMISMEDERARECWLGLEDLIRKTFTRLTHSSTTPRGKPTKVVTYVGPSAKVWLSRENHSLATPDL